ncbi:hypothetical protein [Phytoactinopolyspora mesophila]|uniref:Uncharacterized protein n=1 Tax=Phytoactinopolyspora mesophila TaxID=2650750 RepID=A0A7K3M2V9_9ACTN|nr:hypothetical protein [Phytoactinopolyspora mesophila]NDL56768.1 hypothetical protein [Phytoactinopolyspora mesophila]
MVERRIRYSEERPYVVPDTLEELTGPTRGEVTLPSRLDWSEQGTYNLDDPRELSVMYERVLREAMDVEDLCRYVNGAMLRRAWPRMFLPGRVRALWEERFPQLTRTEL